MYKNRKTAQKNFEYSNASYQSKDRKFKDLKKEIQIEMRRAYWAYIESIITPMDSEDGEWSGMKRFWQFIKGMRKDHTGVATLKDQGNTVSDPKEKANLLNRQFESVFTPDTPLEPELLPQQSIHPEMEEIDITLPGVQKMLERLKVHKATGPDGIGPQMLKNLAPTIAPILTIIYRRSYDTGLLPNDWKKANVVPVYKKGKNCLASNYRPISLTCVACKVMEHIVTSQVMRHAKQHSILYRLQHGFRSQRSCETQLLEFQDDIFRNMVSGKQTDVCIMDFSKAFDKVSHRRLVEKLHHYGIRGKTNSWIANFLAHRTQTVVLEGEQSYEADVTSGVPQGSVLGPCLFLFYINDLPEGLTSKVRLFADDTIVYLAVRSASDGEVLQRDLELLEAWEQKWQMEFHPEKCQILTITRKRTPVKFQYILHGQVLEHVPSAKYLGVTLSHDMRWNTHINNITRKANQTLGFLRRNLQVASEDLKSTAYKTLVRPLVEYAPSVWDPHTVGNVKKVEMVQRRAARYVKNRYRNKSSVSDMLQDLEWTSLEERRRQQRIVMFYKIHNGLIGIERAAYMTPTVRSLPSHSHNQTYLVPKATKDYYDLSFFPRTIQDWNQLPRNVVEAPSLDSFRARLASHK